VDGDRNLELVQAATGGDVGYNLNKETLTLVVSLEPEPVLS